MKVVLMGDVLQNVIQQASTSVQASMDLVSSSLRSVMALTTAQIRLMRWTVTAVCNNEYSPGANVVKLSPVGIFWWKQTTNMDKLRDL